MLLYVVAPRYIKNYLYVTHLPVCRPQAHAHKSNNIHLKKIYSTNRNNEHESMNKNKHKMAHERRTFFFFISIHTRYTIRTHYERTYIIGRSSPVKREMGTYIYRLRAVSWNFPLNKCRKLLILYNNLCDFLL